VRLTESKSVLDSVETDDQYQWDKLKVIVDVVRDVWGRV